MKTQLSYVQRNVRTMAPGKYAVYAGRSFLGYVQIGNGKAVGI